MRSLNSFDILKEFQRLIMKLALFIFILGLVPISKTLLMFLTYIKDYYVFIQFNSILQCSGFGLKCQVCSGDKGLCKSTSVNGTIDNGKSKECPEGEICHFRRIKGRAEFEGKCKRFHHDVNTF